MYGCPKCKIILKEEYHLEKSGKIKWERKYYRCLKCFKLFGRHGEEQKPNKWED